MDPITPQILTYIADNGLSWLVVAWLFVTQVLPWVGSKVLPGFVEERKLRAQRALIEEQEEVKDRTSREDKLFKLIEASITVSTKNSQVLDAITGHVLGQTRLLEEIGRDLSALYGYLSISRSRLVSDPTPDQKALSLLQQALRAQNGLDLVVESAKEQEPSV